MVERLKHGLYSRLWRIVPTSSGLRKRFLRFVDIGGHEYRHLRGQLLKREAQRLSDLMTLLEFGQGLYVRKDGVVYVESDGIFLDASATNRYFKVAGTGAGNIGEPLLQFLQGRGCMPATMVDVGANTGDVTLYFARRLPGCRVLAIEASSEVFEVLKANVARQFFDTSAIMLEHVAVSDQPGTIEITRGLGSENTTVADRRNERQASWIASVPREAVRADTLSNILQARGFAEVDFVKIDIEGGEPALTEDLVRLRPGFICTELSDKTSLEENLRMVRTLMEAGYRCFTFEGEELSRDGALEYLGRVWTTPRYVNGALAHGTDLWFERVDGAGAVAGVAQ